MKILKNNTKETYYTKCKTCESELEYYYSDVKFEAVPFSYAPKRTFTCPVCGAKTNAELRTKETYNENAVAIDLMPDQMISNSCFGEKRR